MGRCDQMTEKVIRTNAKDVKMLAEKLKREGDISPEEVREFRNFFEENRHELDLVSSEQNKEVTGVISLWFQVVEDSLPKYGNYLHTVPLDTTYSFLSGIPYCRDKLPFPDSVCHAEWANFSVSDYENCIEFKYAGDIRSIPELFERMKDMKDIFDGKAYLPILSPKVAARPGYYTKYDLYHVAVIRTIVLRQFPVIYAESFKGRKLLMYPSDIDKIAFILKYMPDDLVKWAHQEGLLNKSDVQMLNRNGWIQTDRPADISDGFAYECYECAGIELLNKDSQDEEWLDVIR